MSAPESRPAWAFLAASRTEASCSSSLVRSAALVSARCSASCRRSSSALAALLRRRPCVGFLLGDCLRGRFAVGGRLPFLGELLFILAAEGDLACILGGLHCLPRQHRNRLAAGLSRQISLRLAQAPFRL